VDALAVPPRSRPRSFTGAAPWDVIRRVVEAVKVPVTGNGDVKSHADARRMMAETGCQSVMIGRGALGKPWVFDPLFEALDPAAKREFKLKVILRHMDLIAAQIPERHVLLHMKKNLVWYSAGEVMKPQEIFVYKGRGRPC